MKTRLMTRIGLGVLVAAAMSLGTAHADVSVTLDGADPYQGYMNVSNLPGDGGAFQFGSPWGTGDLVAVFTGNDLRLSPNTIGDPDPYWYIGGGGPGAPGNKIMEANMYVEQTGPFAGQTVTFSGNVLSNTLTQAHVARVFIRDFAGDFSSVVEQSILLPAAGPFSLSLATINDPGRHVQYGFQLTGVNVWVTDVTPFGAAVIGPMLPTPAEPATWGRVKAQYK